MNSPSQQRTIDEFWEHAENIMMFGTKEANNITMCYQIIGVN